MLTQRPLLGSVSLVAVAPMLRRARRNLVAFGSVVVAFLTTGAAWVVWVSMLSRA